MNYWKQSNQYIYVAAHRGWSEKYPENTMEAFCAALALDVDQIETDVRITKDGELVLIHDASIDRTTNGTGLVSGYTFSELQAFCADNGKGVPHAKIPKLRDLLELVKDHPFLTLDIELKEYPTQGRESTAYSVCDRTISMLREYGYEDRCVINSFSGKLNEYVRENYPDFRQHVYFPQSCMSPCSKDPYDYAYCCCMFGDKEIMASKEQFDAMAVKGIQPWAGAGVKDSAGVDLAIERGAVLITCNNPDEILKLLRERNRHND